MDGFIVDFYCHAAALVVEVDARVPDEQAERDDYREAMLRARDLFILRLTDERVLSDAEAALRLIAGTAGRPTRERDGSDKPAVYEQCWALRQMVSGAAPGWRRDAAYLTPVPCSSACPVRGANSLANSHPFPSDRPVTMRKRRRRPAGA